MRMRIADQFLHIVASAVKDTHWETQLRGVMTTLKLPFDYVSTRREKGFNRSYAVVILRTRDRRISVKRGLLIIKLAC